MAHKCLTGSGVVILSRGEHDFIKTDELNGKGPDHPVPEPPTSIELVESQMAYLGVVIGDRDHTDLNSWSVIALSRDYMHQDP